MRKILFLDIDGVLNTGSHLSQDKYGDGFNPKAVANLAKIVDATGADIVISSSWKFMGLSALEQMWLDRGFTIKYLRLRLPHEGTLTEPDVDIPVDGYRSYNHEVRSTRTTGR